MINGKLSASDVRTISALSGTIGIVTTTIGALVTSGGEWCLAPFCVLMAWCVCLYLREESGSPHLLRTTLVSLSMMAGASAVLTVLAAMAIPQKPQEGVPMSALFLCVTVGAILGAVHNLKTNNASPTRA